jgi:DNA-3-methyladenine glycosylase
VTETVGSFIGTLGLPVAQVLDPSFFARPAAVVARALLGKNLIRQVGGSVTSSIINETEAYEGPHDLACHAARGRTKRTEVMFGPPGTLYVYLVYGMHWMLNVVTCQTGYPAAVLIRGVDGISGPGRVCSALKVGQSLNGRPANLSSGLWFEEGSLPRRKVVRTPRIGVAYAGPIWSTKKLRFVLDAIERERTRLRSRDETGR